MQVFAKDIRCQALWVFVLSLTCVARPHDESLHIHEQHSSQLEGRASTDFLWAFEHGPVPLEGREVVLQVAVSRATPRYVYTTELTAATRTNVFVHFLASESLVGQTFEVYLSNHMYEGNSEPRPYGRVTEYPPGTSYQTMASAKAQLGYGSKDYRLDLSRMQPAVLADVSDPAGGLKGVFAEVLAKEPVFRSGPNANGIVNDQHTIMRRFVDELTARNAIKLDNVQAFTVKQIFEQGSGYNLKYTKPYEQSLRGASLDVRTSTGGEARPMTTFGLAESALPPNVERPTIPASRIEIERGGLVPLTRPEIVPDVMPPQSGDARLAPGWTIDNAGPRPPGAGSSSTQSTSEVAPRQQSVTTWRVGKVLMTTSRVALTAAGIIGGAAFIILDIIHKNWVGVAFGIIGTAAIGALAAIELGLASTGPVGWFIGAMITLLFLILPGGFGGPDPAPLNNATQIIQFQMFGDKKHTGNEGCRTKSSTNPNPNPNCQALYGPGTLSASFKWEMFDAVAFLLQCNSGYPISIPDMAACFNVTKTTTTNFTHYATIDCNNKQSSYDRHSPYSSGNKALCQHPAFRLERSLIDIPLLGRTTNESSAVNQSVRADQIYQRIIGPENPQGDCVLFTDVGHGIKLPYLDMIYTGMPAGVQCGLGATFAPNGTNIVELSKPAPLQQNNNITNLTAEVGETTNSSVILSTSGNDDLAAPQVPLSPFLPINHTNGVCLSNLGDLCLLNGTYDASMKAWGFALSEDTEMTIPSGMNSTLTLDGNWYKKNSISSFPATQNNTSTKYPLGTNVTTNIALFWKSTNKGEKSTFTIRHTPDTAGVCLFREAQYKGSALCYSAPAAGPLPAVAKKDFGSLTLHGGANVEMFAQYYGDGSRQWSAEDIPDLYAVPWGTHSSMSHNISAMAVYV